MVGVTHSFGNTFSNDGNGLDLRVLHELDGGAVDTSGGSKVDNGVNVRVLGHGLVDLLVDGQQGLAGSPVHLADELSTEGVDNTSNGGGLALADEVEIQHALDGSGLQTIDEAACLLMEKGVLRKRAQWPTGSRETLDLVVGRQAIVATSGSHCVLLSSLVGSEETGDGI